MNNSREIDLEKGYRFGVEFAKYHLVENVKLRITELRKDGNTDDYINGFLDGVVDVVDVINVEDFKDQ